MIMSSTAYSQITGISREQKKEIVSTLQQYPIVVRELELTKNLLNQSVLKNEVLVSQNKSLKVKNENLLQRNELSEKQLEVYRRRQDIPNTPTGDRLLLFGSGVGVGTLIIFIIKLL